MENDNSIRNSRLSDDLRYNYEQFMKQIITKANFKKLADGRINSTNNAAQHVEHDENELKILQDMIKGELEHIETLGLPDKTLRGSPHFELVGMQKRFCDIALNSMSYYHIIINPLLKLVEDGRDIIENYNNAAIFVNVHNIVSKEIENSTKHISNNLNELKDNYKAVDKEMSADMKDIERRLMTLEVKSNNKMVQIPVQNTTQKEFHVESTNPDRPNDKPIFEQQFIPRMSSEELDREFEKYSERADDFNKAGTLKQNFKSIKGVVGRLKINQEDIEILQLRLESYRDGLLDFPAVENSD